MGNTVQTTSVCLNVPCYWAPAEDGGERFMIAATNGEGEGSKQNNS